MTKISVVLPVYNGASALPETAASILGQTHRDLELVIVDDGSTDDTPHVIEALVKRDDRVRAIGQPNGGITRALIAGCAAAQSELIARQDCGDVSHPERLARQLAAFDDGVVLVSCAVRTLTPRGETMYVSKADGEDVRRSLRHDALDSIHALPHHGSAMFRRDAYEAAGGYRADFYFAQDLDLWIRIAPLGAIRVLPDVLYDARFDAAAISARNRDEQIATARIALALRDTRDANERERLLNEVRTIRPQARSPRGKRADALALYFIASCLRGNGDLAWRGYVWQALRRDPLLIRAWALALRR